LKSKIVPVLAILVVLLLCLPTSSAKIPEEWEEGDEEEILGHTFEEDMWTSERSHTEGNKTTNFAVSYLNLGKVQAFLVALEEVVEGNKTGVLPYQMFGLHYYNPQGVEVFIGALLAFLMAYDDQNNNSFPDRDEGEPVYYIIPFGLDNEKLEGYEPEVSPIEATKVSDDHYRFGMEYKNLYAFISQNPVLSAIIKTGWIAKFSSLKITYDITYDEEAGTLTTETFYTIGQVTELWAFLFGLPIEADPKDLPATMGLAAVHFVTVFASKYTVTGDETGTAIEPAADYLVEEDIRVGVGTDNGRAFVVGLRGDYDLIDEETGDKIEKDQDALNILVSPKANDLWTVWWQLGFSGGLFSIFAYALSEQIQEDYSGPRDLATRVFQPANPNGFKAYAFWYGVAFPNWRGYKVVHDPTYTAYIGDPVEAKSTSEGTSGCGNAILVPGIMLAALPAVVWDRRKKKGK